MNNRPTDAAVNASHSKEENDWDIELTPTSSQSELPSPDVDEVAENRVVILKALNGVASNNSR